MTNERDQNRGQSAQSNQTGQPQPHQDRSLMGDKPSGARPLEQGKVGQDTDGDGKTVQPGQSHGTGQIKK